MNNFDLAKYAENLREKRICQDFIKQTPTEIAQPEILVRKPRRNEFFRVHPSEDYCVQLKLLDMGNHSGLYLIADDLCKELEDDLEEMALILAVSKIGNVSFLWPMKLSNNGWNASAIEIAQEAMEFWVRIRSNQAQGIYESVKAKGNLAEPVWPAESMDELVKTAFGTKYIDDPSHHVLRELWGED